MKRRACTAGLIAWGALPLLSAAQQDTVVRIGLLSPTSAQANASRLTALRAELAALGHVEARNLHIDYRFAEGHFGRLPELARELAALQPRLIVAINTPAALAAAGLPGSTPVLFASVGDPVAVGLVRSLSRPGGKVSGTTNQARDLGKKRLQLLGEMLPSARRLAVLTQPDDPVAAPQEADLRAAAPALGFTLRFFPVRQASAVPEIVQRAADWRADAVLRVAEPLLTQHRATLLQALMAHRLPAMMVTPVEVREGGLMCYYAVEADEYHNLAAYVDRVLSGAKVGMLPVQQPQRFELLINAKTASALGLAVPRTLLLRADEVIE